jgi:hypothetical protein
MRTATAPARPGSAPKRVSVGVKKARVPFIPCGVDEPELNAMETNSKPIRLAPAEDAVVKKFSQPWSVEGPQIGSGAYYRDNTRNTPSPRLVRKFDETIHATT